jgi:hypothetical protein
MENKLKFIVDYDISNDYEFLWDVLINQKLKVCVEFVDETLTNKYEFCNLIEDIDFLSFPYFYDFIKKEIVDKQKEIFMEICKSKSVWFIKPETNVLISFYNELLKKNIENDLSSDAIGLSSQDIYNILTES